MSRYILNDKQIDMLKRYVAVQMRNHSGCDGTLRYTREWIKKNVPVEIRENVIAEIEDGGGYCDCEVIMNCYEF